jgi:hypothetical protein
MLNDTINAAEAAKHIYGSTIGLGDGSYFDYLDPASTGMTIEDYAFALAYTCRFRGQTWSNGRRAFYGVGQHCVIGTERMLVDGHSVVDALAFLMHESDEVPWGDFASPAKPLMPPEFRAMIKSNGKAIDRHFGVITPDPDLIKRYDIRLFATEKRDLMPQFNRQTWTKGEISTDAAEGYEPFASVILPVAHPDEAAARFLLLYSALTDRLACEGATA